MPRALPDGVGAEIDRGSWPEPPIFGFVKEASGASDDDLFSTFNMGVGMVLVVDPAEADAVLRQTSHAAYRIGRVVPSAGVRIT